MKIIEDAKPRRDGLIEARATWGEITVGTLLAGPTSRTEVWEVVDTQAGEQIYDNKTLWFKIRERSSGAEHAVPPRLVTDRVTVLLESPEDRLPPKTPASDAAAMELIVTELGATLIASRDNATGEIWCPNYASGHHATEDWHHGREELMHLQICHGMDTSAIEKLEGDAFLREITTLHSHAHDSRKRLVLGGGGFPHRHVPEDHSLL